MGYVTKLFCDVCNEEIDENSSHCMVKTVNGIHDNDNYCDGDYDDDEDSYEFVCSRDCLKKYAEKPEPVKKIE